MYHVRSLPSSHLPLSGPSIIFRINNKFPNMSSRALSGLVLVQDHVFSMSVVSSLWFLDQQHQCRLELVRNANSQPPHSLLYQKLCKGVGEDEQHVFNKPSRKFLCMSVFNHCVRSLCSTNSGLFFSCNWLQSLLPQGFCTCYSLCLPVFSLPF